MGNALGNIDGRLERSMRTRQALIGAYLEIAVATGREPATLEVAQRAHCSMRTIFERFGSLGGLGLAAFETILQRHVSTPVDDWIDRERGDRIRFQASVRARTCETWGPLWRLAVRHEGAHEALDQRLEDVRRLTRRRLELMYRRELDSLAAAPRQTLLIALEALLDFGVWRRMRESHGLSIEQATGIWIEAIDRMLPATPAT